MGKTRKPVVIWIHSSLRDWPEVAEFRDQGNVVREIPPADGPPDLILGPTSWLMSEVHRVNWKLAIAASKLMRYPKEAKGAK